MKLSRARVRFSAVRDKLNAARRRTLGLSVLAAMLFVACDFRGRGYEDERLGRLSVGESTEQDVRRTFGTPSAVREMSGGKGLIYPLGPAKPHTLLIKLDAAGKYQGHEDLLTRENFARFRQGMNKVEVLGAFGQPTRSEKQAAQQQATWEWRFLDAGKPKLFVVKFDSRGRAISSAIEDISDRPSDR